MKCALEDARFYFMSLQITVGARNGIDAAVHTLRDALQTHGGSDEYIFFSNRCLERVKLM